MSDLFMHLGVSYSVSEDGLGFDPVPTLNHPRIRQPRSSQYAIGKAYARFLKRREAALIAHTYRVLRPSYGRQA